MSATVLSVLVGMSFSRPPSASFLYSVCLYGVSLAPCCVKKRRIASVMSLLELAPRYYYSYLEVQVMYCTIERKQVVVTP